MDLYGEALKGQNSAWGPARMRVPRGAFCPRRCTSPWAQARAPRGGLSGMPARHFQGAIAAEMRDKPDESRRLSQLYAQIGTLAPRLEEVHATAQLLLQERRHEGEATGLRAATPNGSRWRVDGDFISGESARQPASCRAARCAATCGAACAAAVLTSATLTSCGQFDFFLRESGLHGDDAATTLEVPSPFNYARRAP